MASIVRPPTETPPSDPDAELDPRVRPDGLTRPDAGPWGQPLARLGDRWGIEVTPRRAGALLLVMLALVGGGWWLLRPAAAPIDAMLPRADGTRADTGSSPAAGTAAATTGAAGAATTTTSVEVVVQAAGAVVRPGVYRLASDGRIDDLVRAAGGLAPDADVDRVNLAGPLADGERVWVPRRGETEVPEVVAGAPGAGGSDGSGSGPSGPESSSSTPAGPVDLNTATADQLDTLPGVGPATASAILAYRDEHGRFSSVDDLLDVRGIGDAKLEQLRPLVTV